MASTTYSTACTVGRRSTTPSHLGVPASVHVRRKSSPQVGLHRGRCPEHRYSRADLEINGTITARPAQGRIFSTTSGNEQTEKTSENGHGSFHIFGTACLAIRPLQVWDARPYDMRPHPLTPANVTVTNTLREIAKTAKTVTAALVPVVTAINELCDPENVFRCEDMHFITYNH